MPQVYKMIHIPASKKKSFIILLKTLLAIHFLSSTISVCIFMPLTLNVSIIQQCWQAYVALSNQPLHWFLTYLLILFLQMSAEISFLCHCRKFGLRKLYNLFCKYFLCTSILINVWYQPCLRAPCRWYSSSFLSTIITVVSTQNWQKQTKNSKRNKYKI